MKHLKKIYRVQLAALLNRGAITKKLLQLFTPRQICNDCRPDDLRAVGIHQESAVEYFKELKSIDAHKIWKECEKAGADILMSGDENYPKLLENSVRPPLFLFYRGTQSVTPFSLAIVGSRIITVYGKNILKKMVPILAEADITIVSGLAYGIDATAHEETLKHGGRAIAVLGTPINQIYPRTNIRLAEKILTSGGTIYSEYAPGAPMATFNFPARNRIIAGLSQATLVVLAGAKSGALITAKWALEANREVMAVPGGIFETLSEGTNAILKDGAHVITCAQDILNILNVPTANIRKQKSTNVSTLQQSILQQIGIRPQSAESLSESLNIPINNLQSQISLLEIDGHVQKEGNKIYPCNIL